MAEHYTTIQHEVIRYYARISLSVTLQNQLHTHTRSDNKVMELVPKKVLFYLFINYNVVTFEVHPLYLHTTFPVVLKLFVAFLECILWYVV